MKPPEFLRVATGVVYFRKDVYCCKSNFNQIPSPITLPRSLRFSIHRVIRKRVRKREKEENQGKGNKGKREEGYQVKDLNNYLLIN